MRRIRKRVESLRLDLFLRRTGFDRPINTIDFISKQRLWKAIRGGGETKRRPSSFSKRGWCVFPGPSAGYQCGEAFKIEVPWWPAGIVAIRPTMGRNCRRQYRSEGIALVLACPSVLLHLPVMYPSHPYSVFNVQAKGNWRILSPNVKKTGLGVWINFFLKNFLKLCVAFLYFRGQRLKLLFTNGNLPEDNPPTKCRKLKRPLDLSIFHCQEAALRLLAVWVSFIWLSSNHGGGRQRSVYIHKPIDCSKPNGLSDCHGWLADDSFSLDKGFQDPTESCASFGVPAR